MSYYRNFRIVIGTPLWRGYLRWAYPACIANLSTLGFRPDFKRPGFSVLLSGVGNETTADEFIQFVLRKNPQADITIIDIGDEQIDAVKNLIRTKYPMKNIRVLKIDVLNLPNAIKPKQLDWIETDGFLEFFSKPNLPKLLRVWYRSLKPDGFITLREPASHGTIGGLIDRGRIWLGKVWLGVTLYRHTGKELRRLFEASGFLFVEGNTFLATFKRFSLVKKVR